MWLSPGSEDFLRGRLGQMIDLRRPLATVTPRMPWRALESSFAMRLTRQAPVSKRIGDMSVFCSPVGLSEGIVPTPSSSLVVGARVFSGSPFNDHAPSEQLQQAAILIQDTGTQSTKFSSISATAAQIPLER
jgi:IS5 family transposase